CGPGRPPRLRPQHRTERADRAAQRPRGRVPPAHRRSRSGRRRPAVTALVRSELRKIRTTRTWIGLTLGGLGLVAFYVTLIVFTAGSTDAGRNGLPSLSDPAAVRTVYGVPLEVGYLMPLILGVLLICGEVRHQTITPTFLATPRRGRVLAAKAAAAGIVGLAMGVLITAVVAGLGAVLIAARGYPVLLTSHSVPRTLAVA